jgi:hypothetical protein
VAGEAREDEGEARVDVAHHPHDLDVEALRLGAREDGQAIARLSAMDLGDGDRRLGAREHGGGANVCRLGVGRQTG